MAKRSTSALNHMQFAGKVNEDPDFIAPLTVTHQAKQNNTQPMPGKKLNNAYLGITSTPSHPAPLRYKFVEELSPILQDRNIAQRGFKSRIPLPSNSQSVPVLKEVGQSRTRLSQPAFALNEKEPNPPMVRTERRVSFEINVQYSSVSHSDKGLEMQMCQQTVTARSKSHIHTPTRQQVSVSVPVHTDKRSIDGKVTSNIMPCVLEEPIEQLAACNSTSHNYKEFQSINQLLPNKSTASHIMTDHAITKSKINTSLTGNNKSKSILKKTTLTKDVFEEDKKKEYNDDDDDDDDDIFGISDPVSRNLNFDLENSDYKVKKDHKLQDNDDKNNVVQLKLQKDMNTNSNKNIKVLEENNLNILEGKYNAVEKKFRQLTGSKKIKTSVVKKKLSSVNNTENVWNKSGSVQEENCKADNIHRNQEEQKCKQKCLKKDNFEFTDNKITKRGSKNGKLNTKMEKTDENILVDDISLNKENNCSNKTKQKTHPKLPNKKKMKGDPKSYNQCTRSKENCETSDDENDLFKIGKSTDKSEAKNKQKNQLQGSFTSNDEMERTSFKVDNVASKKRVYSLRTKGTKTKGRSKVAKKTIVLETRENSYNEKKVEDGGKPVNVECASTVKETVFSNKAPQNVNDDKPDEKKKVSSKTEDIFKKTLTSNNLRKLKNTNEVKDEERDTVKETIEYVVRCWLSEENQQENEILTDFEESKLELSTKRLKRKEEPKQANKRKIAVFDFKDEDEANKSSEGSRHSFRKRTKTSEYWRLSQQSNTPTEMKNGNGRVSCSVDLNLTSDDEKIVQMPPGYIVDKISCFSSKMQCLKSIEPGVNECLGITVKNVSCGGHIFIKPGKSYKKTSSNNIMFIVIKGAAHVQIYKTRKVIEENKFFFVPNNVPFEVDNQGSKKLILCFVKMPVK